MSERILVTEDRSVVGRAPILSRLPGTLLSVCVHACLSGAGFFGLYLHGDDTPTFGEHFGAAFAEKVFVGIIKLCSSL